MGNSLQDLRFAFRLLLKNPVFTAVAVSTLALGIGANTAIFSVIDAVLLKPLPYREPDRIVRLLRSFRQGEAPAISIPKFVHWKEQNQVFTHLAAYDFAGPGLNLSGGDRPEQIRGIHVSSEFFALFGAVPSLGRTFTAEEDRPGGPRLAVLSHGLWQRRFGSDPTMAGKPVTLNGEPYTVVGVLSKGFRSYPPAEVWIPLRADPHTTNHGHYLNVAARLKPGVPIEAARSHMKIIGEGFRKEFPQWMAENESVAVLSFQEEMTGNIRPALLVLAGSVGFVLLIACANIANLLLARAARREKEIALRSAMGAGRGRLVRQLLTESLLLSFLGGTLGLMLGVWSVRLLIAINPGNIPRVDDLLSVPPASAVDLRVLSFTLAVSLLAAVVFGLVPALRASKSDLNTTLKEGGQSGPVDRHYARGFLVGCEMALALVLLVGAALLVRSFVSLRSVNSGIEVSNVLTFQTSFGGSGYETTAQVENLVVQMLERLEGLPGVEAASSSVNIPMEGGPDLPFTIEGRPTADGASYHGDVQWRSVAPPFFRSLGVPLLRGRQFDRRDTGTAPPVVIINEAMARAFWADQDPIGKRITIGGGLGPEFEDAPREIVGVVGNFRDNGLERPLPETLYVPFGQVPDGMTRLGNRIVPMSWILKTSVEPRSLAAPVQREFLSVDRQLAVANFRSMEQVLSENTARQSLNMILLGVFAGIALLLAAIGIYGVMSYSVQQRTHEIGIRIALGAEEKDLMRLVVGQAMVPALAGVLVGLVAAFGLTRVISSLLFGVQPVDPVSFAGVPVLLSAVALAASYIPARRAARVDPLIALRYE